MEPSVPADDALAQMKAAVAETTGEATATRLGAPSKKGGEKSAPRPRSAARANFAPFGLAAGLLAGLAAYGLAEFWIDKAPNIVAGQALVVFVGVAATAVVLLAEKGALLRGLPAALAIGAVIAAPTGFMLAANIETRNLLSFPPMFWFVAGAPAATLTLIALARAALVPRGERYTELFTSALTLPMIAIGGAIVAALGVTLVYAFAAMTRSAGLNAFHVAFQQPVFMLPFVGAVAGASLGLVKSLQAVLGAMRYAVVFLARMLAPVTAALFIVLLASALLKGPTGLFAPPLAAGAFLVCALAGALVFNGVYQNGEGAPPPAWLRLSAIAILAALPALTWLSASNFLARVTEFGLTPPRFFGLVIAGLAALYSGVGLVALVTEVRWGAARWMPTVAPMNAGMAVLSAAALVLLATPVVDAWSLSARSQEARLLSGRADARDYDYGYLRFALGEAGQAALNRLAVAQHPQSAALKAGAVRALAAPSWALYRDPPPAPEAAPETPPVASTAAEETTAPGGIDSLPLNPGDSGDAARRP